MTSPPLPIYFLPIRVYYQDTDAGGVVFHANYLKFMERARTEWLRERFSCDFVQLKQQFGVIFVIRSLNLDYLQPARLDDLLQVSVTLHQLGRSRITVKQDVMRSADKLCTAEIHLVCVDAHSFKPVAIPGILRDQWNIVEI